MIPRMQPCRIVLGSGPVIVLGWVKGIWAATPIRQGDFRRTARRRWCVMHLPSGCRIPRALTERSARLLARRLATEFPQWGTRMRFGVPLPRKRRNDPLHRWLCDAGVLAAKPGKKQRQAAA